MAVLVPGYIGGGYSAVPEGVLGYSKSLHPRVTKYSHILQLNIPGGTRVFPEPIPRQYPRVPEHFESRNPRIAGGTRVFSGAVP